MRVFSISDLHLSLNSNKPMNIFGPVWEGYFEKISEDWKNKVTDDDFVLICGDISWAMKLEQAKADLDLIGALPGKKILIRGNHDFWWKGISNIRNLLTNNTFALQNDSVKLGGYVFAGSRGYTVSENGVYTETDEKIFKHELLRLELSLQNAKDKIDKGDKLFCLIHYPPFNSKLEDSEFTKLFEKYEVKKVIYGHLHGKSKSTEKLIKNGIEYYLTSCDKVDNKLVLID